MSLEVINDPERPAAAQKLVEGLADTFSPFILDRNGFDDHEAAQRSVLPEVTMLEVSRAAKLAVADATALIQGGVPLKDGDGGRWVVTLQPAPDMYKFLSRASRSTVTGQALQTIQAQQRTVRIRPS